MFSLTTEYALRAMAELAAAPATQQAIAESVGIPPSYISIVLRRLTQAGLVTVQRGVGGGTSLARPAKRISLLENIEAIEPLARKAPSTKGPMNREVNAAVAELRKRLASTSLADVAKVH